MDEWRYQEMGAELGPVSMAELRRLAHKGTIQPDTLISRGGGAWMQAGRVPGVFGGPAPPPEAPAPAPAQPAKPSILQKEFQTPQWLRILGFIFVFSFFGLFIASNLKHVRAPSDKEWWFILFAVAATAIIIQLRKIANNTRKD